MNTKHRTGLTACWIAALTVPAAVCTLALTGDTGAETTTSGTSGTVILAALFAAYAIGNLRLRRRKTR